MHKNIEIAQKRIQQAKNSKSPYLDLSYLKLTYIPEDISDMTYLYDIDLSYNYLKEFPKCLAKLYNLQFLDLSNNCLRDIYLEPGKVYSLKEFDFSNNCLSYLPEEIFYLEGAQFYYSGNPFMRELPIEIASDDIGLINYYLNSLKRRPGKRLYESKLLIVGKGDVGKTTMMKTLSDPQYFCEIGKESVTHGINIHTYYQPIFFRALKPYYCVQDFENLFIKEHYFDDTDNSEIFTYYPLIESSYYNHNEPYIRFEEEPAIIFPELFVRKEVKINIWDFGGQEILYSTHQFFLTQRSVYILVWEPRGDAESEDFDYWLKAVRRLSNNSPVIVVMNKSDVRFKRIDEASYKKEFNNIVSFLSVSCLTREGIDALLKEISDVISSMAHIGAALPESWDLIRDKLSKLEKDYISINEFQDICNISDTNHLDFISGYLNDLGDIIHFKSDFGLRNLVVINPQWLTKAIYELIHSIDIQKSYGRFNARDLSTYLNGQKYPMEKHVEILLLMEKFEICFKIIGSNNEYIIPVLLQPTLSGDFILEFERADSLKYEMCYRFMPSGIIERLICRMSNYIEEDHFWKYGAIFNTEDGKALIRHKKSGNKICLSVIGGVRTKLLSIIQHELRQINEDLKLLEGDYYEKLACCCQECSASVEPYMFDKETLLRFRKREKDVIDCYKSSESVVIEEILIGYRSGGHQNNLLRSFIKAMSKLQDKHILIKGYNENKINVLFQEFLRPLLRSANYLTNEQSLSGKSESGKTFGELDIRLENREGVSISFFEGFILNYLNKNEVDRHIKKSLLSYDANGLKEKFIGVYCMANNFSSLVKGYYDFIANVGDDRVDIVNVEDLTKIYINASEMKLFKITYMRSDVKLSVYHILVNLKL